MSSPVGLIEGFGRCASLTKQRPHFPHILGRILGRFCSDFGSGFAARPILPFPTFAYMSHNYLPFPTLSYISYLN